MLTRDVDAVLRALVVCRERGPDVQRRLSPGSRMYEALGRLIAVAGETQAAFAPERSADRPTSQRPSNFVDER